MSDSDKCYEEKHNIRYAELRIQGGRELVILNSIGMKDLLDTWVFKQKLEKREICSSLGAQ